MTVAAGDRMNMQQSSSPETVVGRWWLPQHRWDRFAVVAIAVGAVFRIVWILVVHPPLDFVYSDMRGYVTRAERLASGGPLGPDDAFFPPGTHILLAAPIKIFGGETGLWAAAILWCALSIGIVWSSWRLTRLLLTPAAAGITAALCALWPLFITYGGYFTSETPALAFMLAALWCGVLATRRDGRRAVVLALLSGGLGGVAVAIRPQFLINVLIVAVVVVFAFRTRFGPLAGFAVGLSVVLMLAVVHNSVAAGQPTGLATNGGLNFWFGHCEAKQVTTFDDRGVQTAQFTNSVANLMNRGDDYVFNNVDIWDEKFFYNLGWECIEHDNASHVFRLARNVLDMTATTIPFPQSEWPGGMRDVVQTANVTYAVLLPWLVIESLFLIVRRRRAGEPWGELFLLLNLACAALLALLVVGDPRVRSVYDVFGLALLAALLADRFGLDGSDQAQDESEPRSA